jgi:ABC-type transporter Mla subunit MlaD
VTAIQAISGTIEKLSEISSTIAAAVEEQGAATQEISRNVQQAAQGTQQVSSNIADVQRGASETGSASSQVLEAAQSLSGDTNRLKRSRRFSPRFARLTTGTPPTTGRPEGGGLFACRAAAASAPTYPYGLRT